jgi:hypothetical protein
VDIKFNLLDLLSLEVYAQFEQTLLQMTAPGKRVDLFPAASTAARKAAEVIAGLRNEARLLLDWQHASISRQIEMQREYLFALLMTTLNVLRLRHYKETPRLQPYRERALLSAALICRELERLNQGR